MNRRYRTAIALIGLGLITLPPVFAAEPAAPPPCGLMNEPGNPWGGHKHMIEERLNQLHSELKLSPAQEADWKMWSAHIQQAQADKTAAHPDVEALKSLSAPDRLQKFIDFEKARGATLETVLAATKSFYATLTPEQRKTFDDLTPFGARAPRHHGGRHTPPRP